MSADTLGDGLAADASAKGALLVAFSKYCDTSDDPCSQRVRRGLNELHNSLLRSGYTGRKSLRLLKVLAAEHRTELIDHKVFGRFYRFVYFVLRENGHRCLRMEVAIEAWTFVLRGRFRLLDRWTQFVYNNHKHAISEDTWRQVLDFSRCILEDLSNYDPDSAWPVLIDEFVDSLSSGVNAVDCTILQGSVPSGSKRRMKAETDTHVEEDVEGLRQKLAELTPSKPAKRRKGKTADQDEWSNHTASGNCASDFCVTMDSPNSVQDTGTSTAEL